MGSLHHTNSQTKPKNLYRRESGLKGTVFSKLVFKTDNSTTRYAWCKRNMLRFFNRTCLESFPDRCHDGVVSESIVVLSSELVVKSMLRVILSSIVVLVTSGLATCGADATSCQPSELWEVSTRHLSCCVCDLHAPPQFDVNRWQNGSWQKGTIEEAIGPSHLDAYGSSIVISNAGLVSPIV
jgi:hypothetical protein